MQFYTNKLFPHPLSKITWIKWYKESLFKNININNPINQAVSTVSKITSNIWLQHEFIVLSFYDESAEDKTGLISIDWSNDSRIKIRVDEVFQNR